MTAEGGDIQYTMSGMTVESIPVTLQRKWNKAGQ